jgi:hypothetical protein
VAKTRSLAGQASNFCFYPFWSALFLLEGWTHWGMVEQNGGAQDSPDLEGTSIFALVHRLSLVDRTADFYLASSSSFQFLVIRFCSWKRI